MKLINKGRLWQYHDDKFTVPQDGAEGAIELQKKRKKVFGLKKLKNGPFGYKVKSLRRDTPSSDEQTWIRTSIETKWFTLKNKATGRLLTARDKENTVVAGMVFKMVWYLKSPCTFPPGQTYTQTRKYPYGHFF